MTGIRRILFHSLGIIAVSCAPSAVADEAATLADWELPFNTMIQEQKSSPPEKAIPRLGEILGKLDKGSKPELKESVVYRTAKETLVSIPGHAGYFGKEISRLADAEVAHTAEGASNDRMWYFHILCQLPTPETVKVLGELLQDDRDPTGGAPSDSPYVPNAVAAAYNLRKFELRDPPPISEGGARDEVLEWQHWYEQVRAGKRTFSFKGDDTVYTLNGPVAKAAGPDRTKDKLPVILDETEPKKPSILPLFIALCLLAVCIIGGIAVWTKRRSA